MNYVDPFEEFKKKKIVTDKVQLAKEAKEKAAQVAAQAEKEAEAPATEAAPEQTEAPTLEFSAERPASIDSGRAEMQSAEDIEQYLSRPKMQHSLDFQSGDCEVFSADEVAGLDIELSRQSRPEGGFADSDLDLDEIGELTVDIESFQAEPIDPDEIPDKPPGFKETNIAKGEKTDEDEEPAEKPKGFSKY